MAIIALPQYAYGGLDCNQFSRPTVINQTVKFNPGYYWAVQHGGQNPDPQVGDILAWSSVKTEVNSHSALRGVLMRASVRDLETSKGVYNFTHIRNAYNQLIALSNGPKKLCLMLEFRSVASGGAQPAPVTPDYMINDPDYEGASYVSPGSNLNQQLNRYMRLWVPKLVERLNLLSDALAAEFDGLEHFEMIQFSEPILGVAVAGQPNIPAEYNSTNSAQSGTYANGMRNWVLHTNIAFNQTVVMQLMNYPQALSTNLIPFYRDNGIGIGCPNSLRDEPGLIRGGTNPGIWTWMQKTGADKLQDVVPLGPAVQMPENYYSNLSWDDAAGLNGLGTKPGQNATPPYGVNGCKDIVDFIKTGKANYIFITRAPFSTGRPAINNPNGVDFNDWLNFLNLSAQTSTPYGGLNNVLPSKLVV